jgi:hypothetical protein
MNAIRVIDGTATSPDHTRTRTGEESKIVTRIRSTKLQAGLGNPLL